MSGVQKVLQKMLPLRLLFLATTIVGQTPSEVDDVQRPVPPPPPHSPPRLNFAVAAGITGSYCYFFRMPLNCLCFSDSAKYHDNESAWTTGNVTAAWMETASGECDTAEARRRAESPA